MAVAQWCVWGREFHEWIHSGQIGEVCVSEETWCDRGAVLEDTWSESVKPLVSGSLGFADVPRQLERTTDRPTELRNNTPLPNNFCLKVSCVEVGVLASRPVSVWSTRGNRRLASC